MSTCLKRRMGFVRRSVFERLVRPVVIVLVEVVGDGAACFFQRAVFVEPDFFFLEAAVEAFDQAVAFGMVVGGAAMGDAEPSEGSDKARRGELGAIVRENCMN